MDEEQIDRSSHNSLDNLGAILVSNLPTNNNYLTWKHSMIRTLTIKKKLKLIELDPPEKTTKEYENWKEGDCLVIAWILNSIHKDYSESFVFSSTVK